MNRKPALVVTAAGIIALTLFGVSKATAAPEPPSTVIRPLFGPGGALSDYNPANPGIRHGEVIVHATGQCDTNGNPLVDVTVSMWRLPANTSFLQFLDDPWGGPDDPQPIESDAHGALHAYYDFSVTPGIHALEFFLASGPTFKAGVYSTVPYFSLLVGQPNCGM